MSARTRIARTLAALVLGAAGGIVATAGAASAAACAAGTGVTVVVNSSVSCDRNGGGSAASNFRDAGHSLTMASRQPGFVCRVNGYPASDPCINASPADKYWGLFWANGKGGGWTFASSGASGLKVPTGGWVAFKFQTSTSASYPGVTPYTAPAKPRPTAARPSASAGTSSAPKTVAEKKAVAKKKAAKKKAVAKKKAAKKRAAQETTSSASAGSPESDESFENSSQETGDSSSLGWVAGALGILLLGGMGAVVWRRQAAGGRRS